MTLTRRLTLFMAIWVSCILAVFNVVSLVWYRTQSMNTLKRTVELQLSDVSKLLAEVPHLSLLNDGWESSALLTSSSIRIINASGQVTSAAVSPDFQADMLKQVDSDWKSVTRQDINRFMAGLQVEPGTVRTGSPNAYPFAGQMSPTAASPQWLPAYSYTDDVGPHEVIGVEQPFLYPNGDVGRITVAANMDSVFAEDGRFLQTLLWSDCAAVLLLTTGTFLVSRRGLKPLRDLIDSIRSVEWSLSSRVHVRGAPTEVAEVVGTINQLLEQVEKSVIKQQRFITDASHELRTPLAIIAGHANLLRRWGNRNEQVWEPAVRHIVSEVDRIQSLVDHLLLLSRIDAGVEEVGEPLSSDALHHLLLQLREDGAVLRPDLSWGLSFHVPSRLVLPIDAGMLRQVLVNVIDNAIKHTPSGAVNLLAHVDERAVRIAVTDTGEGISAADLAHVFDRFYRAKNSLSRASGGSGLGLSICRQVIEAHDGKITIDSKPGKGTTVTLFLPFTEDASKQTG